MRKPVHTISSTSLFLRFSCVQVNVKAEKDFKLQEKEIATLKKKVRGMQEIVERKQDAAPGAAGTRLSVGWFSACTAGPKAD